MLNNINSIRECDTVITIEKGRIIGIGNPDEMLRKTPSL
jgi:ABC-type multidrug transport system fused ATPase/permease subunit